MESTRREKYEYDIVINERELEEIQAIIALVKKIGDENQVKFLTDMFYLGK